MNKIRTICAYVNKYSNVPNAYEKLSSILSNRNTLK